MLTKKDKNKLKTWSSELSNSQLIDSFSIRQTKNHRNTNEYEQRLGNKTMNTFRTKARPQFCKNLFQSSLNPFARNHQSKNIITDIKKINKVQSFKKTDPISMKYQSVPIYTPKTQFQPSKSYKIEAERRITLPSERKLSQPRRQYRSQVGFSRSVDHQIKPKTNLNNSSLMRAILHIDPNLCSHNASNDI